MAKALLSDYYDECQKKLLSKCIECGKCVDECRVIENIPGAPEASKVISGIKSFLAGGELSPEAYLKTTACMRCYGCVDSECPIGLDSLCINELVWRATERAKEKPFSEVLYNNHMERSHKFTSEDEFLRITTPVHTTEAKVAFFLVAMFTANQIKY